MMTLPAALARRVHTNGPAAAARPAPATKLRRLILSRSLRSIMVSLFCARRVPGALNPRTSRSRRRDRWWDVSRNTPASKVSSGSARVEPILEALPVDHQRHDGQAPGMERDRRDRRHRPAQLGGRDAQRTVGEQLAHDRAHGHATPGVAEADQYAGPRLVQMRQMIGGERDPPAPAMLPLRRTHLGEEPRRRSLEAREESGIAGVVEWTAPTHEEAAVRIEAEVEEDAAEV